MEIQVSVVKALWFGIAYHNCECGGECPTIIEIVLPFLEISFIFR